MSQYHGPQPGYKGSGRVKGVARARRAQKRIEAEIRDESLAPDDPKRRSVRLGSMPEPDLTTKRRRKRKNNAASVLSVPDIHDGTSATPPLPVLSADSDGNN